MKIKNLKLFRIIGSALILALAITGILFILSKRPANAWYNSQWQYRKRLVFNNAAQASNLTNFPVLVVLSSSNFDFTQALSTGADIRFTDSDGTTLLSYEIEQYDATNQQARVWVNVPQIDASSSSDSIFLYWGNPTASDVQSADNTWNTNYKGVYHLNDNAASTTVTDSSGNTNNITAAANTSTDFYKSTGNIAGSVFTAGTPNAVQNPYGTSIAERYPDLVLDSSYYPVITYYDETNGDLVLVHCNDRECKNSDENVNVVDSTSTTGLYPSIQLDGSGYPMIAYYDASGLDLEYVHCNDANCAGGDETQTSLDTGGTVGLYPRMVKDGSGFPVIAYYDSSNTNLKLIHCGNADCSSGNTTNTVDGTSTTVGSGVRNIDLVLDSLGYPVISYYDTTNTELKVTHCNDVNCSGADENINSPLSADATSNGIYTAIELDGSGNPMIATRDSSNLDLIFVHCDDVNCAGSESANKVTVSTSDTEGLSMEKNASGNPVIATALSAVYPRYIVCANTNCSSSTGTYFTLYNQYNADPSMTIRLDSADKPVAVNDTRGKTGNYDVNLYTAYHKLERAYDADYDFGTGSFSVSMWFKSTEARQNFLLSRYDADQGYKVYLNYAGQACFGIDDDATWGPDDSACSSNSQVITNVDNGNAANVSWNAIRLDSSGYPVIAYMDSSGIDLEIIHCTDANCTGTKNYAQLDSGGNVGYHASLVLDSSGFPVVAYLDDTNGDLKLVHCGNANCSSGNTTNTVDGASSDVGDFPQLVLDSSGFPVIAYQDNTNTAVKLAHCNDANCDGVGESIVTLVNTEDDRTSTTGESLKLDTTNGYPMLVYYDNTNGDLEYVHCNDVNCAGGDETFATLDSSGSVGIYASMELDSSGFPVIAYEDATNLDLKVIHCGNADCSSGNTTNTISTPNSGEAGYQVNDLELDNNGYPRIITTSLANFFAYLVACNDVNCAGSDETISKIRDDLSAYQFFSLQLDSTQKPVISYASNGGSNSSDLRLIHMTDTTTYTESGNYDDNAWHHLVAVKNGTSSITTYIDGASVGSDSSIAATATLTSDSATLNLAEEITNSLSAFNWTGQIDEVQIDNTARSADWVAAQYKSENNTFITYDAVQIDGNPNFYWKFDEGYGSTVYNSATSTSISGTISGAAWQAEDLCITGKCLWFDGTNDTITSATTVQGVQTVSFWVRPASTTASMLALNASAYISASSGTISATGFTSPTIYVNGVSSTTLAANVWNHIEVTTSTPITASAITVGNVSAAYTKGFFDEVKFYNYARSAAQVKTDYATGLAKQASNKGVSAAFGSNPASTNALSNGLVGYWKLDESSGNRSDSSGNAYTLTDNNTVTSNPGKFGNAGQFTAANSEYLSLADNANISLNGTSFTIATWVYIDTVTGSRYLVAKSDGASDNDYQLSIESSKFNLYVTNSGGSWTGSVTHPDTLSASTWYHVIAYYDTASNILGVVVNNGTPATASYSGGVRDGGGNLRLGNDNTSSYYDGRMDDVRIYRRYLSPIERSQLYAWAPGPIGEWKMDEGSGNVNDTSGNGNTGVVTGTTAVSGKFGKARSFNGTSDLINAGTGNALSGNGTVEFWLNYAGTGDAADRLLVVKRDGGGTNYQISVNVATGKLKYYDGSTNTDWTYSVPTNVWTHYAIVRNATNTMELFINGISQGTIAKDWGSGTGAALYFGGSTPVGGFYAGGSFDQIQIYNYARTQKQIVEDMNAGHPSVGSPVGSAIGWWKFDEGAFNTCSGGTNDVCNSGSQGTTLDGYETSTPVWTNEGKFGKALNFSSDYVRVDDTSALDVSNVTLSAWYYATSGPIATAAKIVGKWNETGNQRSYALAVNNQFKLYISTTGSTNACALSSTSTMSLTTWYHLVGTFDGSTCKIYVNGVLEASTSASGSIYAGTANLIIGSTGGETIDGGTDTNVNYTDEVKLYNYALTADEVKVEYNRGSAQVLGALGDKSTYQKGAANQEYCVPGDSASCAAPVGEWKLDEKTGTTAYDTSGNGNNGTLTAGPVWTSGKVGAGLDFDGSDDYVALGNPSALQITGAMTLEAWIKMDDAGTEVTINQYVVSKGAAIDTSANAYQLQIVNGGAGSGGNLDFLRFCIADGTSIDCTDDTAGLSMDELSSSTWYHIAGVYDGSNIYFYLNGAIKISETSLASIQNIATEARIGALGNDSRYFDGKIDNVRVFNYARTAAQIAYDYNRGGPVGWWKFDECQGTTAYDASVTNANNGTITIGALGEDTVGTCTTASTAWGSGATGKYNSSLSFDNTDDYVTMGDPSNGSLDFGNSDFSVSGWFYANSFAASDMLVSKRDADASTGWYLFTSSSARLVASLNDASGNAQAADGATLSTGTWYHFAAVFDRDGNLYRYINGATYGTDTSISTKTATISNTYDFMIGARHGATLPFDGQIDDVRVYKYALTATQVKALYNENAAVRFGPSTGSP